MNRVLFRIAVVALLPTAACQTPYTPTDTGAVDTGNQVDAASDAATDSGPPTDSPTSDATNPNQPLSYMPQGCTYTVTTTPGTLANHLGDTTTFGSAPAPTHVHVGWAGDPATTAVLLWTTDAQTFATVAQYGTSMTALSQMATGHVQTAGSGSNLVTSHEVHVCGLTPATTYYYQVGGAGHFSATQTFTTAPAPGTATADVNFVVAGDSRDNFDTWAMVEQQIMAASGAHQPDFQIFSGDAVALGTDQGAWDTWFASAGSAMGVMPFVMVHGNHDALAINYMVQFAQPQAGTREQDELYFSLNYGPIHLVVLNDSPSGGISAALSGNETTWLSADLRNVNRAMTPWVIVSHHKPAFSSSTHSQDADTLAIRHTWPPIFETGGVDVVFNGHDHDFEISQALHGDGTAVASGQRGTVYVTAAGAGASLYPSSMSSYTRYSESVVNFVMVHVTPTMLQLTPHRLDGSVIMQGQLTLSRP